MKPILQKAFPSQINDIFSLYKVVVAGVAKTPVNLGWKIKALAEKISTIHAFCVHPDYWRHGTSSAFLKEVLDYCKKNGDAAIHLDVIDTNDKAMRLRKYSVPLIQSISGRIL